MFITRAGSASTAKSRLRRIEASVLSSLLSQGQSVAPTTTVLSCFRDYFAGVDVEVIVDKMKHSGIAPDLIRYYTKDIFTQAKAELTEWQEKMDEQILAMPSSPPQ